MRRECLCRYRHTFDSSQIVFIPTVDSAEVLMLVACRVKVIWQYVQYVTPGVPTEQLGLINELHTFVFVVQPTCCPVDCDIDLLLTIQFFLFFF